MSSGLMKMWVSFAGMGFMFISLISLYLSRYKLRGFFKFITALFAYVLMVAAGIVIFAVVFSGPVSE